MQVTCPHCHTPNEVVCKNCGEILPVPTDEDFDRPFDWAWYDARLSPIIPVDFDIFDKILPRIRSSSGAVLFHFITNGKGESNHAFEVGYTAQELMIATGIKSTGTMHMALTELGEGLPATKRRKAIHGWNLIRHTNADKKSKHRYGNRYILNTEMVLEEGGRKLFCPDGQGYYVPWHRWITNELFPTLTLDQRMIVAFIHRLTIGFGKQKDSITYNYFTGERRTVQDRETPEPRQLSGMRDRKAVKKVLKELVDLGLVTDEDPEDPRYGRIYGLNPLLSVPSGLRAKPRQLRAKPPVSSALNPASCASDHQSVPRQTPPPHLLLNDSSIRNETVSPYASETDSLRLHELPSPLQTTTDGGDKNPVSEKPPALKHSNEAREAMMRHAFGIIDENIQKAVATATDAQIDEALAHKKKNPKAGGGIFFNFFCNGGKLYKWKGEENPNPSLSSNTDAAPKSPPPPSNGAAPHSPALPPDDNATIWQDVMTLLRQQMTQAGYTSTVQGCRFVRRESNADGIDTFVIAAPVMAVDWLRHRLYSTVQRVLASVVDSPNVHVEFEEFTK